jgi:hypothetical protein
MCLKHQRADTRNSCVCCHAVVPCCSSGGGIHNVQIIAWATASLQNANKQQIMQAACRHYAYYDYYDY